MIKATDLEIPLLRIFTFSEITESPAIFCKYFFSKHCALTYHKCSISAGIFVHVFTCFFLYLKLKFQVSDLNSGEN